MKKITLRDIAEECGVSVTAVSLAMRGSHRISKEKTEEIKEVAQQRGYIRDPMMSALCSYRDSSRPRNRNANINFLQFGEESQSLLNQGRMYKDFWNGALKESKRLGYSLNTIWAGDPSLSPMRLKDILRSRGISGLVVYQSNCPINKFRTVLKEFSLLWLGDGPKDVSIHCVRLNRFSSMKMIWENLSPFNYQKAGLVLVDHKLNQNYGEWEAAHNHYQHKFVGQAHYIPSLTFKSKADCDPGKLDKWIKQWKPQVVISAFSETYPLLQDLGYRIPEDLGYVSLSTKQESGISGIDQQSEAIAQIGIRLLDQLICNREQGIPEHQQIIETNGEWNPGNTLKPAV